MGDSIFIAGSTFKDKGGWISDPQFMEQMGSSYLIAHGLGIPVADAHTTFIAPKDGVYNLYVRTKNWTAHWTDKPTPGIFHLSIDDVPVAETFGNGSVEWTWQYGGKVSLKAGEHSLTLHDEKGFDARFDSALLTTDDAAPSDDLEDFRALRRAMMAIPEPEDKGSFDFVVVGGGVAGMCAAIAAARSGLKVALVQDRKLLGGNNSSEIRVGLGGRVNLGKFPSLGYLLNEFGPVERGNSRSAETYEDGKKLDIVRAEKNITLFLGYKMSQVIRSDDRTIASIIAVQVDDYKEIKVSGKLFADCTGDATLGVLAGAEWRMGREGKGMYNETSAPEEPDEITLGASVLWYSLESEQPTTFPDIDWGLEFSEESVEKVHRGQWYWEVGFTDDQIADAERNRDYGMYVVYSNWSFIKNHASFKEEYSHAYLAWVAYVLGKRESRRLIGDFVLTENDLLNFVIYPDGCCCTSWYIDDHLPCPINSSHFKEPFLAKEGSKLTPLGFYPIPYRCFYSKDIDNMFMAGRNISVSHLALGTTRVMRTTAMIGEVVGLAAAVCHENGLLPRGVYEKGFDLLAEKMTKGVGNPNMPYNQVYTLVDKTAEHNEDL